MFLAFSDGVSGSLSHFIVEISLTPLQNFWWVVLDSKHRGTQLGRMYLHLLSDNKEPCSLKLKAKCLHYGTRFVS